MTMVRFDVGASADVLSPGENQQHLAAAFQEQERIKVAGILHKELPQIQGTATGGVLLIGQTQICGPRAGYLWSVQSLIVTGLTIGATPDVVNFFLDNPTGQVFWQLNGNSPGVTFGKLQRTIRGGSTLLLANAPGYTFAATGQITVSGEVLEVPAQMAGKLA